MHCVTCNKDLRVCVCPDFDAKIAKLRKAMALMICQNCDTWSPLCTCGAPNHQLEIPTRAADRGAR